MRLDAFIDLLFNDVSVYILTACMVLSIYYLVFRKYIFNILDISFFQNFVSSAFATSTVIFLFYCSEIKFIYILHYFVTIGVFYCVFLLCAKKVPKKNTLGIIPRHRVYIQKKNISITFFTVFVLLSFSHCLYQLYIYLVAGIPVLLESRLSINLSGGVLMGFLYRVSGLFITPAMLMCWYIVYLGRKWQRLYGCIYLSLLFVFAFLSGSKGAILNLFFVFTTFVFFSQNYNVKGVRFLQSSRMIIVIVSIVCLTLVIIVIQNRGNLLSAIQHLFLRLSAYGDGYVYGYPNDNLTKMVKIKLLDFLFGDLLHTFRLSATDRGVGYGFSLIEIVYGIPGATSGPNPRFNLVGYSYFGFWGSVVIAAFAGGIFALGRNLFIGCVDKSPVHQVICYYVFSMVNFIETDIIQVVTNLTTNFFLHTIIFLVGYFLLRFSSSKSQ